MAFSRKAERKKGDREEKCRKEEGEGGEETIVCQKSKKKKSKKYEDTLGNNRNLVICSENSQIFLLLVKLDICSNIEWGGERSLMGDNVSVSGRFLKSRRGTGF
jgi:hypothetical protein